MRADRAALLAAALCAVAVVPAARADDSLERVVLRWSAVPGAAGYDLQVATDAGFGRRQLDLRVEVAGYRIAPSDVRRYWRVRAVDGEGRAGQWSATKTIEPLVRAPVAGEGPTPEPEPVLLAVPPLPPAPVAEAEPQGSETEGSGAVALPRAAEGIPALEPRDDAAFEGIKVWEVLLDGRPGAMVGWRANLLGVTALAVELEGTWPLPWLGAPWSAALRAGWWRERASVRSPGGFAPFEATADVLPLAVMLLRSFPTGWARAYAGAGPGVDLVVVRFPKEGALEASATIGAVAGAGRRLGPGEAFAELSGSLGGVDGPLGRMRTGGISLSVGYRLTR